MRIAFFADIHGNREAFDACLAQAERQRAERYVFLGDLVGYGADPVYVVDRVAEFAADGAVVLKGNHDEAVGAVNAARMNEYARAAIEWTARELDDDARAMLAALPFTHEDEDRLYVHSEAAAPTEWRYISDPSSAERSLRATAARVTFCGHVHVPQLYNMQAGKPATLFEPQAGVAVPMIGQRQWLAVLGSVGQPRDKNPAAAWALLDTTRKELTYYRVPYDIEAASRKIHAAGLPQILASRLFVGR